MKKAKMTAISLGLCAAMLLGSGCGSAGQEPSSAESVSHLRILGTEGWDPCNNWDEVGEYSAFQRLEEMLAQERLQIDWDVYPVDTYSMVLQTKLASGNHLPDIAKAHTMSDAALLTLAEEGVILPINEIIDQYSEGPAREAFQKTFPFVKPLTTAQDGNIYWFCNVQNKVHGDNRQADGSFTIQYRRDWADQLGIAEPTNLEEFTQMLVDFREKDANGNGEQDEILFLDPGSFRTAIAQWFDLPTATIGLDPQQQKIVSPWKQPHVGAYFEYLNRLANLGILDPDVAGNYDIMEQRREENQIAAIWDYPDAVWSDNAVRAAAPDVNYQPLMPLPAVPGVEPAAMSEPGMMLWDRFVVTRGCKDLPAVGRLLDLIYSDEYSVLTAYGQEGINFTRENGQIKVKPGANFENLREQRTAEGAILWNGVLPRIQQVNMDACDLCVDAYKHEVAYKLASYGKKYPDQIQNFLALPTHEETQRINELQRNLDIASRELALKLTWGQIPLSELDREVEKLDKLGLSELMEITQARYERYLAGMES